MRMTGAQSALHRVGLFELFTRRSETLIINPRSVGSRAVLPGAAHSTATRPTLARAPRIDRVRSVLRRPSSDPHTRTMAAVTAVPARAVVALAGVKSSRERGFAAKACTARRGALNRVRLPGSRPEVRSRDAKARGQTRRGRFGVAKAPDRRSHRAAAPRHRVGDDPTLSG